MALNSSDSSYNPIGVAYHIGSRFRGDDLFAFKISNVTLIHAVWV